MVLPSRVEDVAGVLRFVTQRGLPLLVLGRGSNLLISDGGFRGLVMLMGQGLSAARFNENFLSAMGYVHDEVIGRKHRMFVDPALADSAEYEEFWEKLRRGESHSAEFRRIGKDGREVWIQAVYNPILDPSGAPTKVVTHQLAPQVVKTPSRVM